MSNFREREEKRRKSFVQTHANEESGVKLDSKETNAQEEPVAKKTLNYKQKAFYLTEKQIKAITLKTIDSDLDKSGVVRAALDMYLADIIENL